MLKKIISGWQTGVDRAALDVAISERTEKNVTASDGTLIISQGTLTGGTDHPHKMTLKHGKQLLHIDFTLHRPRT